MIRLFTSGTHNGLSYTAQDIEAIFNKSKAQEQIPFVFGHPKNNLPVVGLIAGSKLEIFTEGENKSIGFKKENAEFSEESLSAIKELKHNKISVRLQGGIIHHIGLVKKAAVEANNHQDFAGDKMSGDFSAVDNFGGEKESNFLDTIKNIFKQKNMEENKQVAPAVQDMSAIIAENFELKKQLEEKKANAEFEALKAENEALKKAHKERANADFSAKVDALNLPAAEAEKLKAMGSSFVDMGKDQEALELFATIAKRAQLPNGSVLPKPATQDFASKDAEVENEIKNKFLS